VVVKALLRLTFHLVMSQKSAWKVKMLAIHTNVHSDDWMYVS
jgi:hypothetical protein